MSRSLWKGPFLDRALYKKKLPIKIWNRASTIPSSLIGKNALIHNGKEFKRVLIDRFKVGFKFGEFVQTRLYNYRPKITKKIAKAPKGKAVTTTKKLKQK